MATEQESVSTRTFVSDGLRRNLSWSNLKRVHKVLHSVRYFRGHRYVFLRAAANYLHILTGKRRLRVAELSLGNACQLRCEHCYATEITTKTAPLEQIQASVEALDRLGCLSIMLVGGEPTLRQDLVEIVRTIRSRRIVPFMFTNGVLLDRGKLERLKAAGLFGIMFSVLGVGESHDAFVGNEGGFDKLLQVVDMAIELGFFVSFNTTPTHESLARGDFERLSELARERGIGLKFNYPALLGRYADRYEALLDEEERSYLVRQLRKPNVSNDKFTTYFDEMCPAGHFGLYVTDGGEVTPCAYIPISFGNVSEERIEAIHERMVRSPLFGRVHRSCLVGEDRDFIERFIAPTFGREDLPLRWDRHPLRRELVAD